MIKIFLPFITFIATLWATEYKFNRVYLGPGQNAVCGDTDHDGLSEIVVLTYYEDIEDPALEIYENQNGNNYKLVYSDTGIFFNPLDVGDVDGDGLTDLLGWTTLEDNYSIARVYESPDSFSYPSTVSWECWYDTSSAYGGQFFYFADLDQDGKKEVVIIRNDNMTISIFENVGDNQNELVFSDTIDDYASTIGFGDFDEDGKMEFATAGALGYVFVDENTGDNTYKRVFEDSIPRYNGHDVFTGNDTDQDGLPEFFINYGTYTSMFTLCFYLYRYEATGDNTYEYLLIDSIPDRSGDFHIRSSCGDVDGDGVEEIVWSIGSAVAVLKATGNDQYERVWEWENDHKHGAASAEIRCYDLNHDGKDEIVVSGNEHTSIFEYDTTTALQEPASTPIQVLFLSPNPFRQTITLSYSLSQAGQVELKVYDLSGRCIKTLLATQRLEPGVHSVTWDGKADNGQKVASGVYFYRLETKDYKSTKKVVRLR